MGYKVKVVEIDRNKKGTGANGEYTYTLLKVDYHGNVSDKRIMPGTLKKFPNLKSELDGVKEGMTITLDTVKEGNYTLISKITAEGTGGVSSNNSNKAIRSNNNDDYAIGQQVGNALTNAAATLGGKATVKQLEERAYEIILAGNRLKERIKNGDHLSTAKEQDAPPSIQHDMHSYDEDGEDIPF